MTTTPDDPDPDGGVNRPDAPTSPAGPQPGPAPDTEPYPGPETGPLPLAPSNPRTRPETD